jgi:hypothetical protein
MSTNVAIAGAPKRAFCTYFDANYLSRGIIMIGSLLEHDPAATVFVLCLDDTAARVLGNWFGSRITTLRTEQLHQFDPRLPTLRDQRHPWEFYATHKPVFMHFLLTECGPFSWVVFIDADSAFYSSLTPLFDEIATASVGLSPHRFADRKDPRRIFGRFNAGFVCFHDDPIARRCLRDWREDCIDWCYRKTLPDGRYMNQGYLDRWLERYPNVAVIRHPGVNLAPWNVGGCRFEVVNSKVLINGQPLISFHFSALLRKDNGEWHSHFGPDLGPLPQVRAALYTPYVKQVEAIRTQLMQTQGLTGTGSVRFDPTV